MRRSFHRQMPCTIDDSGTMKAGITVGQEMRLSKNKKGARQSGHLFCSL